MVLSTGSGMQGQCWKGLALGKAGVRERLIAAAFELFDTQSFEQTTVDDIAERAGVGRTTFFRYFRSKEAVIFPDHDAVLALVEQHLAAAVGPTPLEEAAAAARLILLHYVDEGDHALSRYRLTSSVPSLRDRELASVARYQRVFRRHIEARLGTGQQAGLTADLISAAVVTAHNHVLRRWLRGKAAAPLREFDEAVSHLAQIYANTSVDPKARSKRPAPSSESIVVLRTSQDLEALLPSLKRILGPHLSG